MTKYSIQFRIQRITTEYAYVLVPVTDEVVGEDGKLDVEKMTALATTQGEDPSVRWYLEEQKTAIHPIQKPCEPGEAPSGPGVLWREEE